MLAVLPAWGQAASPPDVTAQQLRVAVRDALEAQRAAGQAAERQEEAAFGRRLTPAERAQLRQQLRQEWARAAAAEAEAAAMAAPAKSLAPSLDMTAGAATTATAATAGEASLSSPVVLPRGGAH